MNRTVWTFVVLNTIGGIGHHIDHTFRGHVGWPLIADVNGYTITLLIYVAILIGAILSRRDVVGPGFWAIFSAAGFVYTLLVHFVPASPDPPMRYAHDYGSSLLGALAMTWLGLFLLSLLSTTVYCARRWASLRQASLVARPAH